jgi:hypothetical protein
MPWTARGAKRHTKKAKSAKKKRQWAHVANSMLKRTGDEGAAVRAANAVVKRGRKLGGRSKKKRKLGKRKKAHKR